MALDVVGRDGGSLDSSFQRLNDAMALASKRSAQRRSSTPFTANVVSDCNRSPFDWTRNRGLIFNDQSIFEAMDRDEIADGNSRAGVLLGLFQISIIGSLFLAIPINLVGLIFLKIKSKMGNEQV